MTVFTKAFLIFVTIHNSFAMKKNLLFILLLFWNILLGFSQIVVDYPYVENASTEHLMINRLEITDSLTVLHCDAYHLPNYWVMIPSQACLRGESGKIYKLIRSQGFELDKEVYMPESGTVTFSLYFEPLDKTEPSFDFMEDLNKINENSLLGIRPVRPESDASVRCILKGEVIDRPLSNRLKLTRSGEDLRLKGIYIPIKNGTFAYELNCDDNEVWELSFVDEYMRGSWRPVSFFSENGIISMKLYPQDRYEENKVEGGNLNQELNNLDNRKKTLFWDEQEKLYKEMEQLGENQYGPTARHLFGLLETAESAVRDSLYRELNQLQQSGEIYSAEGKIIWNKMRETGQKEKEWELEYIKNNVSLTGYFRLLQNMTWIERNPLGPAPYVELFNQVYQKEYPEHPYTMELQQKISTFTSIKKGGKYIDFTAPDFDGNSVTLSDRIKGKVALIDLWASWCGPCRRLSKSMIPVYEEYKDKGFTVIGVAREEKLSNGINAAEKDGYPWLNLVDLQDENKIWEKYGVGNAGGSTFLVDRDGTILAVHPTAEEVRKILDSLLK